MRNDNESLTDRKVRIPINCCFLRCIHQQRDDRNVFVHPNWAIGWTMNKHWYYQLLQKACMNIEPCCVVKYQRSWNLVQLSTDSLIGFNFCLWSDPVMNQTSWKERLQGLCFQIMHDCTSTQTTRTWLTLDKYDSDYSSLGEACRW